MTREESRGLTGVVPRHVEPRGIRGLAPFENAYQAIVLEIENPEYTFRGHVLIDPGLRLVYTDEEPESSVLRFRRRVPRVRRHVQGTVAYLSNFWVDNYYHWMQLTLPLLRLYSEVVALDAIDYFYVGPSSLRAVQEETLKGMGIARERILRQACSADRVLAGLLIHREQRPGLRYRDSFGHAFVREALTPGAQGAQMTRLYVLRGAVRNRRLLNERALIGLLSSYGFRPTTMDGLSVQQQAAVFAGADVIVGVHGAALANLLFSSRGSSVVEIFPPGHVEVSHFATATHSDLNYYYLIGDGAPRSNQDFLVDLRKVDQLLREFSLV